MTSIVVGMQIIFKIVEKLIKKNKAASYSKEK
jgi:hypothetical protein